MEEDHETIKLENLRLMMNFKTEIQKKSAVLDGILQLAEENKLNNSDLISRLKQSQSG